ncbi:hypothetical protein QTP88_011891 [Uroleucon formosanum]
MSITQKVEVPIESTPPHSEVIINDLNISPSMFNDHDSNNSLTMLVEVTLKDLPEVPLINTQVDSQPTFGIDQITNLLNDGLLLTLNNGNVDDSLKLLFKTVSELDEFELNLKVDELNEKNCLLKVGHVKQPSKTVYNLLKKVMTNKVDETFNITGKGNKNAFGKYKISQIIQNNFSAAKRQFSSFCETSTTEIKNSDIWKPRKRVPKRNYDSFSENENNIYTQHSKTKNQVSQITYGTIEKNENIAVNYEPSILYLIKISDTNIPKPKESLDIWELISNEDSTQGQKHMDLDTSSPEMFKSTQNESEEQTATLLYQMINNIGHALMNVSNKLTSFQKEISIIKLDFIKNQDLLTDLIINSNRLTPLGNRQAIDRGSLKIPVNTLEDLNIIEQNDGKIGTLAQILQRDSKSFDVKRSTYMAMKMIMQNREAEYLNMEGRRDCIKDFFPHSTLIEVKGHVSDWLKQAPRQKYKFYRSQYYYIQFKFVSLNFF